MSSAPHRKARKKPTNVSVDGDLLNRARDLHVNISSVLEQALEKTVKEKLREQWLAENRDGIAQYNELVDAVGVYSDDERAF